MSTDSNPSHTRTCATFNTLPNAVAGHSCPPSPTMIFNWKQAHFSFSSERPFDHWLIKPHAFCPRNPEAPYGLQFSSDKLAGMPLALLQTTSLAHLPLQRGNGHGGRGGIDRPERKPFGTGGRWHRRRWWLWTVCQWTAHPACKTLAGNRSCSPGNLSGDLLHRWALVMAANGDATG